MTLDLPARLLADRVTVALAVAGALALEAMLARHPGSTAGSGLAIGLALLGWQGWRARHRPHRLCVDPSGVSLQFGLGAAPVPANGPRARVLGRSVVLHWQDRRVSGARQGMLWLTPADLPDRALHALHVALVAGRATGR